MKKCLFIVNPISGGFTKEGFLKEVSKFCQKEQLEYAIVETKRENNETRLREAIENFTPDTVAACGGDGTVNLVAQCIKGSEIPMAIIPLGSANGLASELNIPNDPLAALQLIHKGKTIKLDAIGINEKYFCLHLSDTGFNATIIDNFERSSWRGQFAYLIFFIKSLFSDHIRSYDFYFPDKALHLKAAMVVLANGRQYGFGAAVNPVGHPDDGKFEVCIFKKYPWYAFFGMLLRFLTGHLKTSNYYEVFSTQRVHISANNTVELQIDGEAMGPYREIDAIIQPQIISMIVPKHYPQQV